MNDKDERHLRDTAAGREKTEFADAYVDRIAARLSRELEVLKMNAIVEAMPKPCASGPEEDKELYGYYRKVAGMLDTRNYTLEVIGDMYTIYALIKALQSRFSIWLPHFYRVSEICVDLGKMMGLSQHDLLVLDALGVMHDVGKLGISDTVLFKRGALTEMEWEDIKRHPTIGYKLIKPVHGISELADFIWVHHERWDGKGYPQGLKNEEIPLAGRILTVADSIDAMINDRPYRKVLPPSQVVAELHRFSGTQFDPTVVEAFFDMIHEGMYMQSFLSPLRDAVEKHRQTQRGGDC